MLKTLPKSALVLGLAGLSPLIICVILAFDAQYRFIALAAGYFYAALILSFLGGIWWGVAIAAKSAPGWIFAAAVVPSLFALLTGIPWMTGGVWPGPSLIWLGVALVAALAVDFRLHRIGIMPYAMLQLRIILSTGLGALTMILGVV